MNPTDRPDSETLRRRLLEDQIVPMARAAFARDPAIDRVLFVVAQYWDDAGDDAVHGRFLGCTEDAPPWPDCARWERNRIGVVPEGVYEDAGVEEGDEAVSRDTAFFAQEELWADMPQHERVGWPHGIFDDDGTMIVAFASHCLEGASQEDPWADVYVPYCVVHREGARVEIVGRLLRPALENCWHLLEAAQADDEDVAMTEVEVPLDAPAVASARLRTAVLVLVLVGVLLAAWALGVGTPR